MITPLFSCFFIYFHIFDILGFLNKLFACRGLACLNLLETEWLPLIDFPRKLTSSKNLKRARGSQKTSEKKSEISLEHKKKYLYIQNFESFHCYIYVIN